MKTKFNLKPNKFFTNTDKIIQVKIIKKTINLQKLNAICSINQKILIINWQVKHFK